MHSIRIKALRDEVDRLTSKAQEHLEKRSYNSFLRMMDKVSETKHKLHLEELRALIREPAQLSKAQEVLGSLHNSAEVDSYFRSLEAPERIED